MSGRLQPKEKHIIGIPVLPYPTSRQSLSSLESPGGSIHEGSVFTDEPARNMNCSDQKWKLRHVDFMPQVHKGKKEDEYENFASVVRRANEWGLVNTQALVFTCETFTWSTIDHPVYSDNGLMQKSMHTDKKTRFTRGLRLWYMVLDEVFYEAGTGPGPWMVQYADYVQSTKTATTTTLLDELNRDISATKKFKGKIIKVETLQMLNDAGDSGVCHWREQPENAREYTMFLRVFSLARPTDGPAATPTIDMRDFIPVMDGRTVHSQGYEVYADLWRRVARWVHQQPDLKLLNLHAVFVKFKKGGDLESGSACLWERLAHKEHGSAHGALREQKTEYLQIIRVIFYPAARSSEPQEPKKIFYKTFSPVPLHRPPGATDENDRLEMAYEDLQSVQEKINAWINHSGAQLLGVESIPSRLTTGGQESIGPEATMVYNGRERNVGREYWRNNIRLHIQGEYRESPTAWVSRIVEQTHAATG